MVYFGGAGDKVHWYLNKMRMCRDLVTVTVGHAWNTPIHSKSSFCSNNSIANEMRIDLWWQYRMYPYQIVNIIFHLISSDEYVTGHEYVTNQSLFHIYIYGIDTRSFAFHIWWKWSYLNEVWVFCGLGVTMWEAQYQFARPVRPAIYTKQEVKDLWHIWAIRIAKTTRCGSTPSRELIGSGTVPS